jgi:hypothetical protein
MRLIPIKDKGEPNQALRERLSGDFNPFQNLSLANLSCHPLGNANTLTKLTFTFFGWQVLGSYGLYFSLLYSRESFLGMRPAVESGSGGIPLDTLKLLPPISFP